MGRRSYYYTYSDYAVLPIRGRTGRTRPRIRWNPGIGYFADLAVSDAASVATNPAISENPSVIRSAMTRTA
jgi:hypothetical protein